MALGTLQIGRLLLGAPPTPVSEPISDAVGTLGGAAVPAARTAPQFQLALVTYLNGGTTLAQAQTLRRQLRSLLNNSPLKFQYAFLYIVYSDDTEQDGWYVPDATTLAGIDKASWKAAGLWQTGSGNWLLAGRMRSYREARAISMKDLRTDQFQRDTLGWIISADFSGLPGLALTALPNGVSQAALTVSGQVVSGAPQATGRDGGTCQIVQGLPNLTVVSYERPEAELNLSDVIVYDRRANVGPFGTYQRIVLADRPLGYWRLDENPLAQTITPIASDQTGNHPGNYEGTQTANLIAVPLTSTTLTGWMTGAAAPTGFAGTPTTGGSLGGYNVCAVITALGSWGESLGSTEIVVAVGGANNAIAFSWTAYASATSYNIYVGDVGTTVAAGSNGVNVNTFTGSGVLYVAAIEDYFPTSGTVYVQTSGGVATVTYTGVDPVHSTFTGCTFTSGSAGTMSTGGAVVFPATENAYVNATGTSYTMTAYPAPQAAPPGSWLIEPGATLSAVSSPAPQYGSAEAQVVTTNAFAKEGIFYRLPKTNATVSVYLRGNAGGETVTLIAGSSSVDNVSTNVTLTTSWQRVTLLWNTQAFISNGLLSVVTQSAAVRTFFVNAVQASVGPTVLPYSDTQSVTLGQQGALTGSGDTDSAALFDGDNGYVDVPYSAALNTPTFSAEIWIKPTVISATTKILLNTLNGGVGWRLAVNNGVPRAQTNAVTVTGGLLTAGQWAHLVYTYDGATIRLYVNGVLVGSGASAYAPQTAGDLGIGADTVGPANFATATLDEPAVYGYALTASQIANHYNAGTTTVYDTAAGLSAPSTDYGWEETYGPDYPWSWL